MELKELVQALFEANQKYHQLAFDGDYDGTLQDPASDEEIAALESKLNVSFPDDYRAFLQLHNGWLNYDGEGRLLGTKDHGSQMIVDVIAGWSDMWESDDPDPFANGAVPVMMGEDIQNFVVLTKNSKGEMVLESYDSMEKEDTFPTFTDYLQQEYKDLLEMIEEEEAED